MQHEPLIEGENSGAFCTGTVDFLASVVDGLSAAEAAVEIRKKQRLNSHLNTYLCLLKHMCKLHRAEEDLTTVATDVTLEKNLLKDRLSLNWSRLRDMRLEFIELTKNNRDTFVVRSDIQLSLADYQRTKELFALFNHIDDLVRKTLCETERIGKMAFYSRQFDSLNRCKASSGGFDGVLDQLLGHMAQFHETREYIDAQLSLARSSNVGSALSSTGGTQVDKACIDGALRRFLEQGTLPDVADVELVVDEVQQQRTASGDTFNVATLSSVACA